VLIVTIRALHQSFIHAMAKWFTELGFYVYMARIAKSRLCIDQQKLAFFSVMRRMTVDARYIIGTVGRTFEIAVFFTVLMAFETAFGYFRGGSALEHEYLALITAAGYVLRTWAVACLATLPLRATSSV
jgi:hypothetical protein